MLFVFLAGWVLKEHKIKHINPRKHTDGTKIQVCVMPTQPCQKGVINDFCVNHLMLSKRLGGAGGAQKW